MSVFKLSFGLRRVVAGQRRCIFGYGLPTVVNDHGLCKSPVAPARPSRERRGVFVTRPGVTETEDSLRRVSRRRTPPAEPWIVQSAQIL